MRLYMWCALQLVAMDSSVGSTMIIGPDPIQHIYHFPYLMTSGNTVTVLGDKRWWKQLQI